MSLSEQVIATAKAEVGYHEGRSGGHWNNHEKYAPQVPGLEWAQNQAWCATFVSWVAMKAGAEALFPRTASCDVAASWFKQRGRWSEYPAVGAQVFYGSPSDLNHTGIVVAYDNDNIYTVEGNTNDNGSREGDGVYAKTRRRRDANVVGYGYPDYPEGIDSADPSYRKAKPKHRKPKRRLGRLTRGKVVDQILALLKKAKGRGRRARDLAHAEKDVLDIHPWREKK